MFSVSSTQNLGGANPRSGTGQEGFARVKRLKSVGRAKPVIGAGKREFARAKFR